MSTQSLHSSGDKLLRARCQLRLPVGGRTWESDTGTQGDLKWLGVPLSAKDRCLRLGNTVRES